jgi:hypothetical protein
MPEYATSFRTKKGVYVDVENVTDVKKNRIFERDYQAVKRENIRFNQRFAESHEETQRFGKTAGEPVRNGKRAGNR